MAKKRDAMEMQVELTSPEEMDDTTARPYRILIAADFAGGKGDVSGPLIERVTPIDATTFDQVMASASPVVSFTVADPLSDKKAMVELNLKFDSIKAFDPLAVAQQIPATKSLLAAREHLVSRMRGKTSPDQLNQAIEGVAAGDSSVGWLAESLKWKPGAASPAPGAVDDVLSQLDLGDGSSDSGKRPKSAIGALVSAAAGGGSSIPSEEASAIRRTLAEIDRRVNLWLNLVLHSPQVQPIEAAWRSLAFLVARTDFRKGVRLLLLHARQSDLSERFIKLLIDPVFDEGADAPDLIVADYQFGAAAPDLEMLDELAQHANSIPAVAIAGVGAAFFGVKHAWQIPTLPPLTGMFDQWQFAKWKTLRTQPYARALGVIFGRGLLRPPHQRSEAKDLEFAFREDAVTDQDCLWAGGVWTAACAVARSMAQRRWPTGIGGFVHGRIEGFATAEGGKDGKKKLGPTDTQIPQTKIEELAAVGLNAVVGVKDHEDALFWNALTVARPARLDTDGLLEISLPYRLFASRLSNMLFDIKPNLAGKSAEEVTQYVIEHVKDWLKLDGQTEPEQLSVQTRKAEDDPAALQLAVTVTPPPQILPGGVPLAMGYIIK